jgi:broad specificity phosphatase PhoE
MQTLWLVRHAHRLDFVRPEWFDTAIYPYDPPLSELGKSQAIALAERLSQVSLARIFTSPFLRTIQTADPLARLLQLPIQLEWGLCEWLCKDWTRSFPTTTPLAQLKEDYHSIDLDYDSLVIPPYPETLEELSSRMTMLSLKFIQANPKHNLLIIAHKGSTLGMIAALTGDDTWLNYDLQCAGLIQLVHQGSESRVGSWELGVNGENMTRS